MGYYSPSTHEGAVRLAKCISDYWRERGYGVRPAVVLAEDGIHYRLELPPFPRGYPPDECKAKPR